MLVPGDVQPFRILVIQAWTIDPKPVEDSLRGVGLDVAISRVDFEAALNAAVAHERFDAVIFDRSTPDMLRETVEACLKINDRDTPLLDLDDVATLGSRVLQLLTPRRN